MSNSPARVVEVTRNKVDESKDIGGTQSSNDSSDAWFPRRLGREDGAQLDADCDSGVTNVLQAAETEQVHSSSTGRKCSQVVRSSSGTESDETFDEIGSVSDGTSEDSDDIYTTIPARPSKARYRDYGAVQTMGVWILLMIGIITGQEPDPPPVELHFHHGVYFRPLSEVIVTGSEWTLCTTISLVTYEEAHTSLKTQIDQVEGQLANLQRGSSNPYNTVLRSIWEKLMSAFEKDLANYQNDLGIVKSILVQSQSRRKRGLINVVSDVGKFLFGFSTEKDTKSLSSRINELAGREENLTHIATEQFSYVRTVATQVLHNGEQVENLQSSFQEMIRAIENFQASSNAIEKGMKFATVGLEMLSSIDLIREGLSQPQTGLKTIQKIIANAGEGTLAWELFEDSAFRTALIELGDQLPTGWKLLYEADDHYSYLHYIDTETYKTEENINLCSAIPIIKDSGRYQLYEAISMPVIHPEFPEKLFFLYKFESPYLAVQKVETGNPTPPSSGGSKDFFTMNDHREIKCVGEEPRVCTLYGAVNTPPTEEGNCLYDLFSDSPSVKTCPVQVQYQDGPGFRHVGAGVWLYGAARGTLQVHCMKQGSQAGSNTSVYQLTGTGAFRLQSGCEASLGHSKIPSYIIGKGRLQMKLPDVLIVVL